WFNHKRLHGEIGLVPPVEFEQAYYDQQHTVAAPAETALLSLYQTRGDSVHGESEARREEDEERHALTGAEGGIRGGLISRRERRIGGHAVNPRAAPPEQPDPCAWYP
ncbi:hypothetical protein, partial [Dermacoccus nishinomiyaensis]|uniref:hypothetical protein n=1 Tax=Dermacoccus nishinomiyaensis TaxID=1274 RepID=UPI00197AED21